MPGNVSDSYDPEFGTGANGAEVADAIRETEADVTRAVGSKGRRQILDVVRGKGGPPQAFVTDERQLRIIRFCLDRALETI